MARNTVTRRGPAPRRRRSSPRTHDGPSVGDVLAALQRPRGAAIGVLLLAALFAPWLAPGLAGAVASLGESIVRALGLGAFGLAGVIAYWGWRIHRRDVPSSRAFWQRWLGGLTLALFALGMLSVFRPGWSLGSAHFAESSAGGELGRALLSGFGRVLIWLALGVAGCSLVWPRTMLRLARHSPTLWQAIAALRLPERAWGAAKAAVRGARWLARSSRAGEGVADGDDALFAEIETGLVADGPAALSPGALLSQRYGGGAFARIAALRDDPHAQLALPFDDARPLAPFTLPDHPDIAAPPAGGGARPGTGGWTLPAIDLLKPTGARDSADIDNVRRAQLIVATLASFGVDARVVEISEGPTVTQFGVEPGWEIKTRTVQERDKDGRLQFDKDGRPKVRTEEVSRTRVRVNQITSLANDLALALAAPSLRIEAPVPGRPVVGIEVPNHDASVVNLRTVLESGAFSRLSGRSKLALALGQGVSGESIVADLAKMPHLLIAGATGSGKSVCLNAIITCILMHGSPEDVRFVMIDPKRVELAPFADTPHLAFSRIIVDVDQVPGALQAVISEMEARYRKFAHVAARNIEAYNRHPKVVERLPYWVVVIDELADLMMAAPYEVERQICRLAQLARATGIHLIVATQRPSVDVVTGLIKANFPTRIAFAVSSQVDSRTILDGAGAEKLLGRGDMLYMATDAAGPKRLQGVYVSDQEIEALVAFWRREALTHRPPTFDHLLEEARERQAEEEAEESRDSLFGRARDLALEHTRISTSMLQRRLRIGYPRAARLMDELEAEGIVGPAEGGASREVLIAAGALDDDPPWNAPLR